MTGTSRAPRAYRVLPPQESQGELPTAIARRLSNTFLEAGRLTLQDCQGKPAIIARLRVGDLRLRLL